MAQLPYMPFYVADYLADTAHLSTLEHGAYLLLIFHYWQASGLPSDDKKLARIARVSPQEWARMRGTLIEFFSPDWKHGRIEVELTKSHDVKSKRHAAGIAGASARYSNRIANAQQTNAIPNPTSTPTPTPTRTKEEISSVLNGIRDGKLGVTIENPQERLARFQAKLAQKLGPNGWPIVMAALDDKHPDFIPSLNACKAAARDLGKGWPRTWGQKPTQQEHGG